MYPYIYCFGTMVSSFNLMVGIGFITAILALECCEKQLSVLEKSNLLECVGLAIPFSFIGAMFFDKLMHYKGKEFWKYLFTYTGMSFAGGILAATIAVTFFYKLVFGNMEYFSKHLNILAGYVPLGHAFGRIGCFMGGCCYGKPTKYWCGFLYPKQSLAYVQYGNSRIIPVPLIESVFLFCLYFMMRRSKNRVRVYILSYAVVRFFLEYLRGDDRGSFLIKYLSPTQWICMGVVLIYGIKFLQKKFFL